VIALGHHIELLCCRNSQVCWWGMRGSRKDAKGLEGQGLKSLAEDEKCPQALGTLV